MKRKLMLVTLATPALTAAEPALAHSSTPAVQTASQASEVLKAQMLAIDPAEKLSLAGDVLLSRSSGAPAIRIAKSSSSTGTPNDRTNTDIPECRGSVSRGSSSSSGKPNDRTNTDIPECHTPGTMRGAGTGTTTKPNDRTNTDIPECHSPSQ